MQTTKLADVKLNEKVRISLIINECGVHETAMIVTGSKIYGINYHTDEAAANIYIDEMLAAQTKGE